MDNKDNKKKRKKGDQTTLVQTTPNPSYSGGEKEHKVPWQEKYATPKEIKAFLSDHIYLPGWRPVCLRRMPSARTVNWLSSSATTTSR